MIQFDKINNDVAFREHDHKYFNIKNPELVYTSVTTLIGQYHEKFDKDFFSKYKALERLADPNVFNNMKANMLAAKQWKDIYLEFAMVKEEDFKLELERILLEWELNNKNACDIGTAYHLERENEWYANPKPLLEKKVNLTGDFPCIKHDFSLNREKAIMPEYLVYFSCKDQILNIAGQVDLLIKDGNDIYILDYKTNAKGLEEKAYFNKKTKQTKKMFYPVNNLEDTKMNHYNLQLSIYAFMLRKINPEFNIKLLKLIHIDREGKETEYEIPYLEEEVKRLFAYHKKVLKDKMFKKEHDNLWF
jgi:hypothetical protein